MAPRRRAVLEINCGSDYTVSTHKGPPAAVALFALTVGAQLSVCYIFALAAATEAMVSESPFTSPLIFTCWPSNPFSLS
jgi:hypothetical protein